MLDVINDMPKLVVYDVKWELLRQNIEREFIARANKYRGNPEELQRVFHLSPEQYKNWTIQKCFEYLYGQLTSKKIDVCDFLDIPKEHILPLECNETSHALWDSGFIHMYLQKYDLEDLGFSARLTCSIEEAIKKYDILRNCNDAYVTRCRAALLNNIQIAKKSPYGPLCMDLYPKTYY